MGEPAMPSAQSPWMDAPAPVVTPPKKSNRNMIIAIVVAVVLLCCCCPAVLITIYFVAKNAGVLPPELQFGTWLPLLAQLML